MPESGKTISQADCPECSARIGMRRSLTLNEVLLCPECDCLLRVVRLHPLELAWALETGADATLPEQDVLPGEESAGGFA